MSVLPSVDVLDNSDLAQPFRKIAEFQEGKAVGSFAPFPSLLETRTEGTDARHAGAS